MVLGGMWWLGLGVFAWLVMGALLVVCFGLVVLGDIFLVGRFVVEVRFFFPGLVV